MIAKFLITASVFMAIDLIWLGLLLRSPFMFIILALFCERRPIGPWPFYFYGLFIVGLIYYAVEPAIIEKA